MKLLLVTVLTVGCSPPAEQEVLLYAVTHQLAPDAQTPGIRFEAPGPDSTAALGWEVVAPASTHVRCLRQMADWCIDAEVRGTGERERGLRIQDFCDLLDPNETRCQPRGSPPDCREEAWGTTEHVRGVVTCGGERATVEVSLASTTEPALRAVLARRTAVGCAYRALASTGDPRIRAFADDRRAELIVGAYDAVIESRPLTTSLEIEQAKFTGEVIDRAVTRLDPVAREWGVGECRVVHAK